MGHISATPLFAGAQAGKSLSRAAVDRAQTTAGRASKEIRDVVKLSHKALRIIDKVEARVGSIDVNSSRGAEKMADLQKKIQEALDKLFEKAAKAGITLVIEDDTPAPEAPAPKAAAPESPAPKAAVASARELVSAAPAPAPAAAKSETLSVAAKPSSSGLRSSNSGSGKPGLISDTTTIKTTGQARAAEVRNSQAEKAPAVDTEAAAKAKAKDEAASQAEKRVVVIKASVLKEITDFKALSRLIADTDTKLTVAAGGGSVEEVVKMAAVQTVLRESSIDTSGADIRALKTYQTMVDLMQDNNRKATQGPGEDVSRRNHIDFAA